MKKKYLKTIILGLVVLVTTTLKAQEYENYAILYNDDVENLLDTVLFYPNSSSTVGTLRCGAMENGKKKKGVKGKVVPTEHVKKAYFHNRTYIAIPFKSMKGAHLCHVIAYSKDDILVVADFENIIKVWVIDNHTYEEKTRPFALRNNGNPKNVDYNLKYFNKAVEGAFEDYPDLIKQIRKNIKESKELYQGLDYYKCGDAPDLYESLKEKYEELAKKKFSQRKNSYERPF